MLSKKLASQVMRELGRKGGKIGGKRSLETMTAEERSARAKKASTAAAQKREAKTLKLRAANTKPSREKPSAKR